MTCRTGRQPVREFTRNKTTQVSVLFRLEAGECDHYTKGPVGGVASAAAPTGCCCSDDTGYNAHPR